MKVTVLVTMSENLGLYASLHRNADEAWEDLRQFLNSEPVSYQDPLPEDATAEQIETAANDRSQFAWEMLEQEVPS